MELDNLKDLYIDELKDLYSAEKQLIRALPKMAKNASNPELKRAFQTHLEQTKRQVERLERVFEELEASPRGKKCVGMEGLIEEAQELIGEESEPEVLDAGLISKAQHVEHYEMAGYGTVRTYARQLGYERQAQLLQQTLDEEGEADKLLTRLAESSINFEAARADEDDDESTASRGGRSRTAATKRTPRNTEREITRGVESDSGFSANRSSSRSSSTTKGAGSESRQR